jgi:hypothetical protein
MSRTATLARKLLYVLAGWGILTTGVVAFLVYGGETDPDKRAILSMGIGLIVIWCIVGGTAMRIGRDRLVGLARKVKIDWRVRFFVLCIVMALLEEGVTTSLTNAAPLFGAATDAARITAAKNYLEVVMFHSVIAFVPMFICWGWLLSRYSFSPVEVMLLFGLNGTLAETLSFGPQNLLGVGMWVCVYGLMVYLPAHTAPVEREAREVRLRHWILAAFLPLVFIIPLVVFVAAKVLLFIWRRLREAFGRGR